MGSQKQKKYEKNMSQEKQCRICLDEEDKKFQLFSPCNCKGSSAFVCLDCWEKCGNKCEICKSSQKRENGYTFLPYNYTIVKLRKKSEIIENVNTSDFFSYHLSSKFVHMPTWFTFGFRR